MSGQQHQTASETSVQQPEVQPPAADPSMQDMGGGGNAFVFEELEGEEEFEQHSETYDVDLSGFPWPPGSQPPAVLIHEVHSWADLSQAAGYVRSFLTTNRCHPYPGAILDVMDAPLFETWRTLHARAAELIDELARGDESDPEGQNLMLGLWQLQDELIDPFLDLLEETAVETSNLYVVTEHGGGGMQFRYLTEEEFQAEAAAALQALRDEALTQLEDRLWQAQQTLLEFERINQESGVTAWISDWFNPMDSPSEDQWDNASAVLAETRRALEGDDLEAAVSAVATAQYTFNTMVTAVNGYIEGAQAGAGMVIVLLQITQTVAFAAASGCAGATFMANAGTLANAAFNVGTAVVGNLAGQAGNAIFLDEEFDWGSLALDVGLAAGGSVLNDVVCPRLMGDLPGAIARRFPTMNQQLIQDLVGSMGSTAIAGMARDAVNLASGRITYEDLLMNIVINLGAGASNVGLQRVQARR